MNFTKLYEYKWKLIDPTVESLQTIDWNRALNENISGWGSLRNLAVHTIEAEDYWFTEVLQGKSFADYEFAGFQDIELLRRRWREVSKRSLQFISGLTDNDMTQTRTVKWDEKEYPFAVEEVLLHVDTHTVHHRGQIALAVRQMGGSPSAVDIL